MRGALAFFVAIWALPGAAPAADPAIWDCQEDLCTARVAAPIAREEAVFEYGAGLSIETDPGRLTDLELQSWREYRFVVEDRARVAADIQLDRDYVPQDWPDEIDYAPANAVATLHSSLDGEVYQLVDSETALPAGSYLSVIVTQATDGLDGPSATFYPAKWTLEVAARRVVDAAEADQADPARATVSFEGATPVRKTEALDISAALEAELGCVGLDCPEPGEGSDPSGDTAATMQGGTARSAEAASGDPLAAELQTELARVGCYTVAVDGLWGPGSRRAMADFNRETGTGFPTDAPTPGALVAVARTQDSVCREG